MSTPELVEPMKIFHAQEKDSFWETHKDAVVIILFLFMILFFLIKLKDHLEKGSIRKISEVNNAFQNNHTNSDVKNKR